MKKTILIFTLIGFSLGIEAQNSLVAKEDVYVNKDTYSSKSTGNGLGNLILFGDGSNGGGWQSSIKWSGIDGFNGNLSNGSRINAEITVGNIRSYGKADLIFKTKGSSDNGTPTEKFRISANGNVGIGTTSPNARLEIKGSETSYHQMIVGGGIGAAIQLESKNNTTQRPVLNGNNGNFSIQMWKNRGTWKSTPFHIDSNGMIGIGIKDTKGFKLGVNGKIAATEVKVATYSNWADFVFKKDYQLPTLLDVENHIKEKGHLKDIPNAKEVEKDGFFLGEMDAKLLQKIEELTLYTIEQGKKIKSLEGQNSKIEKQQKDIEELKTLVKQLLNGKN